MIDYISTVKPAIKLGSKVPHKVRELAISYIRHYKLDFDTVKNKLVYLMSTVQLGIKLVSS